MSSNVEERFNKIDRTVKGDGKLIVNTLLHYFGGADALWHAVHEHITDLNDVNLFDHGMYEEEIDHLEQSYQKAVNDIVEQEFLVNDD